MCVVVSRAVLLGLGGPPGMYVLPCSRNLGGPLARTAGWQFRPQGLAGRGPGILGLQLLTLVRLSCPPLPTPWFPASAVTLAASIAAISSTLSLSTRTTHSESLSSY